MADEALRAAPGGGGAEIAAEARRVLRSGATAALGSRLARAGRDWPYVSLVLTTPDERGRPLLFLSDLAEHSRAIAADPAVSLLFEATQGHEDPLTGPRLTLVGEVAEVAAGPLRESLLDRFAARHPGAAGYRGFKDFRLYRLTPVAGHLVAGFGVIRWLDAAALVPPGASEALEARHDDIVTHMNDDHADALQAIAAGAGAAAEAPWRLVQLDSEALLLAHPGRELWVPFPQPVSDADETRRALILLAKEGRRRLGQEG